nr:hypothetical protein [Lachnospiraceae bacterium]
DSCIEDHIMEEFLLREKAGVINMHVLDFNEELHNQSLIDYGVEQGTDTVLINMIKAGKLSDEEMAQYAGCTVVHIEELRRGIAQTTE